MERIVGVRWTDMHQLAENIILEALKEGGLVVGDVDEMVKVRYTIREHCIIE